MGLRSIWLEIWQIVQRFCGTRSTTVRRCFDRGGAGGFELASMRPSKPSLCLWPKNGWRFGKLYGGFRVVYAPTGSVDEKGRYRVEELKETKRIGLVPCDLVAIWPRFWPEKVCLDLDRENGRYHERKAEMKSKTDPSFERLRLYVQLHDPCIE